MNMYPWTVSDVCIALQLHVAADFYGRVKSQPCTVLRIARSPPSSGKAGCPIQLQKSAGTKSQPSIPPYQSYLLDPPVLAKKQRSREGGIRTTHAGLLVLPNFAHPPPLVPCELEDLKIGVDEPGPVMGKEAQDGGSFERGRIREVDLGFFLAFFLRRPRGH